MLLFVDSVDILIKFSKFCVCIGRENDVRVELSADVLVGMDGLRELSLMKLSEYSG